MKIFLFYILIVCSLFNFISCNLNSNLLEIHYIDVGQGDATLIQYNTKNLLIDSGPNTSEEKLNNT